MKEVVLPWCFVAAGGFTLAGAVLDWDWFFESRKARFWVNLFGRAGARAFYAFLGIAILGIAVAMLAGWISLGRGR